MRATLASISFPDFIDVPRTRLGPLRTTLPGWLLPGLAILFGGLIRTVDIAGPSLWFDEGFTAWIAQLPLLNLLDAVAVDTSPPLYYLVIKAWTAGFGISEASLRGLSAACGMGTIALTWLLARRVLRDDRAASLAAWLSAGSFLLVAQSRDARFYSLLGLLVVAALICLHELLIRGGQWIRLGYVVFTTLALYTHNVALPYWMAMHVIVLLTCSDRPFRQRVRDIFLADCCILVLYSPWIPLLWQQLSQIDGTFWTVPPTLRELGRTLGLIAGVNGYDAHTALAFVPAHDLLSPTRLVWAAQLLLAIGIIGSLLVRRRPSDAVRGVPQSARLSELGVAHVRRPLDGSVMGEVEFRISSRTSPQREARAALIPTILNSAGMPWAAFLLLMLGGLFAWSHVSTPIFMDRIFTPLCAVAALLVAAPLASGYRVVREVGFFSAMTLLVLSVASTSWQALNDGRENWRDAVAQANRCASDGSLLIFYANEGELLYDYYQPDAQSISIPRAGVPHRFADMTPPRARARMQGENDFTLLDNTIDRSQSTHLTLLLSHGRKQDQAMVLRHLSQRFVPTAVHRFEGVAVYEFRAPELAFIPEDAGK